METVKTFKAIIDGKEHEVKAVRIDDVNEKIGYYWLVTASELLLLLEKTGHLIKLESFLIQDGLVAVTVKNVIRLDKEPDFAVGSCLIGKEHGNDPVGIAHRRAISNFAFQTGLFDDVFDKLRELNKGTLDPRKGDALNDSVTKSLGL